MQQDAGTGGSLFYSPQMGAFNRLAMEAAQLKVVIIGMTAIYPHEVPKLRLFLKALEGGELDELRTLGTIGKLHFLQRLFDNYLNHPSGRC